MVTRYLGPALFLGVALAGPATLAQSTTPTFIEGAAFSTGTKVPTATVTLTGAVAQGNLLVGWFAQYGDPAQVRVSDNVNGTWTRAPRSLTFLDDTGDIALYYRENSQAAPGGVTITASVSSSAYLLGSVADYSGVALAGSLDEIASARDLGTAVDSGATAPVGAGELVFAALVSGGAGGSVTPGSSLGVPYDHSAPSAPLTVTTPAASPEFIQGAAASAPNPLPSYTLTLSEAVLAGDLLVGWFSQFGAPGQVQVSDNVNGPWTRSVSTTWGGSGDIALFYRENSAPAPSGLVITASASASAYLQEAVADFRGVAAVGALDQTMVAQGQGSFASVGPTASVPAGELVVAAVLTGGQPGWVLPGSSQRVPYVLDVQNGSSASDLEDILSSAAGPQEGSLTLGTGTNWNMVLATFRPASTTTTTITQPVTTTTTTTRPPSTSSTTSTSTTQPPTSTTKPPTTTTTTTTTPTPPPTTPTTTPTTTPPPTSTTPPPTTTTTTATTTTRPTTSTTRTTTTLTLPLPTITVTLTLPLPTTTLTLPLPLP